MPEHDVGREMVVVDCEVLGRSPEWNGRRLTISGYVLIPQEKFWRFWLLAGIVKLLRRKPTPDPLNQKLADR